MKYAFVNFVHTHTLTDTQTRMHAATAAAAVLLIEHFKFNHKLCEKHPNGANEESGIEKCALSDKRQKTGEKKNHYHRNNLILLIFG